MSQENVESLRAFLDEWGREPWTLEAWEGDPIDFSLLDPEVVYEDTTLPDHIGEAYRGHVGVRRAARRWIEPFEWLLVELERIEDAGDRLVSIHGTRGKMRHTGIEFDGPVAYIWTFQSGKVVHFRSYRDPAEALEAVGLSEQDPHADS
jgi:ketosteroid isomerase-like protein